MSAADGAEPAGSLATAPEVLRFDIGGVERSEVLRYLGYHGQAITPELEARLDAVEARCLDVCEPAGVVRVFDVLADAAVADGLTTTRTYEDGADLAHDASQAGLAGARSYGEEFGTGNAVLLAGTVLRLTGRDVAAHLDGALGVALLCVTLGMPSERELARLALTCPLDQVIFDSVANALVERAADAAEARVVAMARKHGLYAGDRYAPGYGDLGLDVQGALLDALNARKLLGVSLTPSDLLVPTKSETAVIGLHPEPQPRREGEAGLCRTCNMREFCTLRAAGMSCRG